MYPDRAAHKRFKAIQPIFHQLFLDSRLVGGNRCEEMRVEDDAKYLKFFYPSSIMGSIYKIFPSFFFTCRRLNI
jgi:hypothetical protein